MRAILILVVVSVLGVSGCVTTGGVVKITGVGDAFEDRVEVSTFSYERPFMEIVNPSDYYFRGYIDKKSGDKSYQLYTITNSVDWMHWDQARILIDGELLKLSASIVSTDAKCSQYSCAHYEDVVVGLKREILDRWASSADSVVVRFASSRASGNIDIKINKTEVLDFLNQVDSVN